MCCDHIFTNNRHLIQHGQLWSLEPTFRTVSWQSDVRFDQQLALNFTSHAYAKKGNKGYMEFKTKFLNAFKNAVASYR